MILLDTDHLSVLRGDPSDRREKLSLRMNQVADDFGTTIITVEEQMRGWLASVAKERLLHRKIRPYDELARLIEFFGEYYVVRFDHRAADICNTFTRIRIGISDRMIAAIAIANNALLLTANRRDFELVPSLRFENWLD